MVVVQVPGAGADPPKVFRLEPGQSVSFGRGVETQPVDIPLSDPAVSRLAGHISCAGDHWAITNLNQTATYVIENPESDSELINIAPRRVNVPVPFEFSRVLLPATTGSLSFLVFAPGHSYAPPASAPPGAPVVPLDESAAYFLVLVAMCEPRLKDPGSTFVPTVPQIVERLRGLDHTLAPAGVSFHLDYLTRHKLRLAPPPGADANWQRSELTTQALRLNLVRHDHLELLP